MTEATSLTIDTQTLRMMFIHASRTVSLNRELVDRLNVFPVPDGDTGTNMSLTLKKMEEALGEPAETPGELARKAARNALMGARGNSGVILSQILRGLAEELGPGPQVGPAQFAHSLVHAADCAYQAVIKPVEGTILTVAKDAAAAAMIRATEDRPSIKSVLDAAISQARVTLAHTPQMLDKLKQAGVVDAGGQGFVNFLEGMRAGLLGETIAEPVVESLEKAAAETLLKLPFLYCTEVNIIASDSVIPGLRGALEKGTDSLMVVGNNDMVHVHVHTNDPGMVLSHAVKFGELADVKVDNMRLQHNERIREVIEGAKVAVVAVVAGEGMKSIFSSLSDAVVFVEGGQSMNPSTEEILNAVKASRADEIIILPNNPNIILSASKVKELTDKKIHVVPTKTMPHGLSALVEFDPDRPADESVQAMKRMADSISVAEITTAVRDAFMDGVEVRKGQAIAILDGKLLAAEDGYRKTLEATIENMIEKNAELVTLYSGEGISDDEAEEVRGSLGEKFPDVEFELHNGGQPHYMFLVSGE
ncbi:MAG: DAK2 domain-containing protein [bacterium]